MGEYAVLYGAPAIVQAVDRYVVVTVEPSRSSSADIEVHSLGAELPVLEARWGDGLSYAAARPEHSLVMTILDALCVHGVIDQAVGGIKCTIDSRELFHNENKLGLGSSAAITHALSFALFEYARTEQGSPTVEIPAGFVFNVHRAFQHGRGSGADIGAGVMGGTYSFQRVSEHTLPVMESIELPGTLQMLPVWVGKPASTSAALGTLADFQYRHPGQFTSALTPLMEIAHAATASLMSNDAESFITLTEQYGHNLSEFGRTVGVDIVSEAHATLRKLAAQVGVVYKPSGAGNGDFGLGYALDIKALRVFAREVEAAGFSSIPLNAGLACHRA